MSEATRDRGRSSQVAGPGAAGAAVLGARLRVRVAARRPRDAPLQGEAASLQVCARPGTFGRDPFAYGPRISRLPSFSRGIHRCRPSKPRFPVPTQSIRMDALLIQVTLNALMHFVRARRSQRSTMSKKDAAK